MAGLVTEMLSRVNALTLDGSLRRAVAGRDFLAQICNFIENSAQPAQKADCAPQARRGSERPIRQRAWLLGMAPRLQAPLSPVLAHRRERHPFSLAAALRLLSHSILGPTVVAACAFTGAAAADFSGVPHVYDADTLYFDSSGARLWGIDAPELETPEGRAAQRAMSAIIGDSMVTCIGTGSHSYNRTVSICSDENGRDLGELIVRAGYAVDWPRFSNGRYAAAEADARRAGAGLWASPSPAFVRLSKTR